MTALEVMLSPPLDEFIEDQVRSGAFPDAAAVIRAGLRLLRDDDAAKTRRFEAMIQEGLDDLAAGRMEVVDDIDAWLEGLGPQSPG